jgi:hypothetical protein
MLMEVSSEDALREKLIGTLAFPSAERRKLRYKHSRALRPKRKGLAALGCCAPSV